MHCLVLDTTTSSGDLKHAGIIWDTIKTRRTVAVKHCIPRESQNQFAVNAESESQNYLEWSGSASFAVLLVLRFASLTVFNSSTNMPSCIEMATEY